MRDQWALSCQWLPGCVALILMLGGSGEASAERAYTSLIPNGTRNISNSRGDGCGHCHVLPGSKSLNLFGWRWQQLGWGPDLASEDSDEDDVSNGWELGDPAGTWIPREPDPGVPTLVTSPGQSGSVPPVLSLSPLEIDHFESQGENLWQSFTVGNLGGDCFGNPTGACVLSFDTSSDEAWMVFDPEFAELAPGGTEAVDILFTTDGLLGELEGLAAISALGVWNSPQNVLVTLTVPELGATSLDAAALLALLAMARVCQRTANPRAERPIACDDGPCPAKLRYSPLRAGEGTRMNVA